MTTTDDDLQPTRQMTDQEFADENPDITVIGEDGEFVKTTLQKQVESSMANLSFAWRMAQKKENDDFNSPEAVKARKDADDRKSLFYSGYSRRSIEVAERALGPAIEKARTLLPRVLKDGILLILGPTGRGKTVMATWFAMQRQKEGQKCGEFITAYSMFTTVKSSYGPKKPIKSRSGGEAYPPDAEEIIANWSNAPFLVIDEIQTRAETAWEDSMLEEIVNARYGEMLPTVLIANLDAEAAQKSLGPRIMDRARECGGIVNCNWPSYRQ